MIKLTKRQQKVLDCIKTWAKDHGCPPTYREIMSALGFKSPNAVNCHIQALVNKNAISVEKNQARGIRLVNACPCCGRDYEIAQT